jgi:hypothetical protein
MIWPKRKPAVLAAITVLSEAMPAIPVSADMPDVLPEKFVRVTRIGGAMSNPAIDMARILIEVFGAETADVEDLSATASQALHNAVGNFVTTTLGEVFVRGWDNETGPVDRPHPQIIDYERWQFHGDLMVKTN